MFIRDEHSSLLRKSVNYKQKNVCKNFAPSTKKSFERTSSNETNSSKHSLSFYQFLFFPKIDNSDIFQRLEPYSDNLIKEEHSVLLSLFNQM
jgi:hypothetical protein